MRSVAAMAARCLTATVGSSGAVVERCDGEEDSLERLRQFWRELCFCLALRHLPVKVALFQWRAHRLALRLGDEFSLASATRPGDLAKLIELARSRECVTELGTGTAWTAISLALADHRRTVRSYDPIERSERDLYIRLVGLSVRDRVELRTARGADRVEGDHMVELLYIDSSHAREETIEEVRAWQPALADGAFLVFDDFAHAQYPGVREAVAKLDLGGEQHGGLFVHRWSGGSPMDDYRDWSGYGWSEQREERSVSLECRQSLIEHVLNRWIPIGAVTLEIGPGAGYWSQALALRALRLVLVDVNERPLQMCKELLGEEGRVEYVRSSGNDLPGVFDGSIDAVWSFDAFTDMTPREQEACLQEIARVLTPGGTAVIRHRDRRARDEPSSDRDARAPMSRELFAVLASRCGLRVETQLDSWGPEGRYALSNRGETITVCRR